MRKYSLIYIYSVLAETHGTVLIMVCVLCSLPHCVCGVIEGVRVSLLWSWLS